MEKEQATSTEVEFASDFDDEDIGWEKDDFLRGIKKDQLSIKSKSGVLHQKYSSIRTEELYPVLLKTYELQELLKQASMGHSDLSNAVTAIDAMNIDTLMAECAKEMKKQLIALREAVIDVIENTDPSIKEPHKKRNIAPKYFNPADPSKTWSGCGAEPAWIKPFRITESYRLYSYEVDIENIEEAKAKTQGQQSRNAEIINFNDIRNRVSNRQGYSYPSTTL